MKIDININSLAVFTVTAPLIRQFQPIVKTFGANLSIEITRNTASIFGECTIDHHNDCKSKTALVIQVECNSCYGLTTLWVASEKNNL